MKNVISTLTLAALSSAFAFSASASDLELKINTFDSSARATVLKDGQPVSGVPVKVTGSGTQTYTTSESGYVNVYNLRNNGRTFTFEITDDEGNTITERRFVRGDS
ncbi:hypothetical protein AB2S62_20895 [Vibrio sp. NTOU-M3]|uniref:hypothetical protein n=1 Tax=Vibrio sp. NTOU-M3 TaxID=3234954 RepID=UPI00349FB395